MENSKFEFQELLDKEQFIKIPSDTILFREGDAGDRMYIVVVGEISLEMNGQVLGTAGIGGIVGEMALIDESPRTGTATTLTDCVLAPLDMDAFMALVRQRPEFSIYIMRVLTERLRQSNDFLNLF
jgi:CRP-like cAMP-binding protein